MARVARLATLDAERRPHLVPICFAYDGSIFYSAIDRKPKRVAPSQLARLKNIKRRPRWRYSWITTTKIGHVCGTYLCEDKQNWFSTQRNKSELFSA
jgi:hypothetical protein